MKMISASELGRRAWRDGLKLKDCPFHLRHPCRSWWIKGYTEARKRAPFSETPRERRSRGMASAR